MAAPLTFKVLGEGVFDIQQQKKYLHPKPDSCARKCIPDQVSDAVEVQHQVDISRCAISVRSRVPESVVRRVYTRLANQ